MKCYKEIDFKKSTIDIDRKLFNIITERKRSTTAIDRIIALWFLEKQRKIVSIDKEKYKVITVRIPYPEDWVILQNEYLPFLGEYFLN